MEIEGPFTVERRYNEPTRVNDIRTQMPIALCSNEEDANTIAYALNKQYRIDDYDYEHSKELDEILPLIEQYKEIPETVLVSLIENVFQTNQCKTKRQTNGKIHRE